MTQTELRMLENMAAQYEKRAQNGAYSQERRDMASAQALVLNYAIKNLIALNQKQVQGHDALSRSDALAFIRFREKAARSQSEHAGDAAARADQRNDENERHYQRELEFALEMVADELHRIAHALENDKDAVFVATLKEIKAKDEPAT